MAHLLRSYNAALLRRPMLTQCISASILFAVGDIMAQQAFERKGRNHDFVRTARLTLYRGLLFGPPLSMWYAFLNRIKTPNLAKGLLYRVGLDQALLSPVAIAFFFGSMSVLEGRPDHAIERIQTAFVPTLLGSWAIYIPTQLLNFSIVPPHLRAVCVSGVSLFWNAYLSVSNARHQVTERNVAETSTATLETLNTVY